MKDKKEKNTDKITLVSKIFKRKKLLVVIVIASIVGVLVYRNFTSGAKSDQPESHKVEKGTVKEELVLSGKIDADEYVALSYPVSGKVTWVGVKEGDKVKKGQILGKLDTTSLNASYQQARAALRAAEATLENVHDQVKDNDADETYSQKETRTTAEVAKDRAFEAVKIAEDNLRNATLYSPFEGIVSMVASPFSGINTIYTQTQFEVINPKTIFFDVTADQTEVVNIKENQTVEIVLDAYPQEKFVGTVSFVSFTPVSGDVGTSYKIKIRFDPSINLDLGKFRLGMGGDSKFVLKRAENVLYVPPKFIKSDKNGKYVNLEKKNYKVYVETGLEGEDSVEIISGLTEGQTVFD